MAFDSCRYRGLRGLLCGLPLFVALSGTSGCREPPSACATDDCGKVDAGAAGAGPEDAGEDAPALEAGDGDTPPPARPDAAECLTDDECDDGKACNGKERCQNGACRTGTALKCPDELSCVEGAESAACEFEEQSPWLLFFDNAGGLKEAGGLFGTTTASAATSKPIDLASGAVSEEGQSLWFTSWSADGRYLAMNVTGTAGGVFYREFGRGLPSPAAPIPDVPRDPDRLVFGPFAKDRNSLILGSGSLVFEVHFETDGPHTQLLAEDGDTPDYAYCAGGNVVLLQKNSVTGGWALVDLEAPKAEAQELSGVPILAPNRKRFVAGDGGAYELADCARSAKATDLQIGALLGSSYQPQRWAPDSRHLMFMSAGATTELALVDTVGANASVRWKGSVDDDDYGFEYWFSADSRFVLLEEDQAFSLIEVASGTKTPLDLPSGATQVSWADDGATLLYHRLWSDSLPETYWIQSPGEAARELFRVTGEVLRSQVWFAQGFALVLVPSDSGTQILRVDLKNPKAYRELLSAAVPGDIGLLRLSPDARGVLFERSVQDDTDVLWLPLLAGPTRAIQLSGSNARVEDPFQPWPE